jgi:hypothetical protein
MSSCHAVITPFPSNQKCRSQWPRGLWPLACWDCGFECRQGHGRADYSAGGILPSVMCLSVIVWPRPTGGVVAPWEKTKILKHPQCHGTQTHPQCHGTHPQNTCRSSAYSAVNSTFYSRQTTLIFNSFISASVPKARTSRSTLS